MGGQAAAHTISNQAKTAEAAVGGDLAHWLGRYRVVNGRSYRWIADELAVNHHVHVSHATVRSWCRRLGVGP